MELAQSIRTAWTAVEESGVPEHMQELAFKEALRSLLGTAPQAAPGQQSKLKRSDDGGEPTGDDDGEGAPPTVDEHAVIAAVSEHTGVAVEKLDRVFHLDNGVVKILVNHSSLGSNAADKTRAAAQIITVVRKVGMGHADTDFDIIREECQRKHFYDSGNFASKHLPNIDGFAVKGEGRSKRLEARNGGLAAFPVLVDKVLGES
jgi:hypothetical protein